MASWVMHLVVAEDLLAALHGPDRPWDRGQLLLGALAPDATTDKRVTHFKGARYQKSDGAPFRLGQFQCELGAHLASTDASEAAFYAGYLSHLIADDLAAQWLFFVGIKRAMAEDPAGRAGIYADYDVLNAFVVLRLRDAAGAADALRDAPLAEAEACPLVDAGQLGEIRRQTLEHLAAPAAGGRTRWLQPADVDAYLERAALRSQDAMRLWL